MFHKLKSAAPLPDYTLLAHFSDGTVKSYDFRPLFARMEVYAPLSESPALWASAAVDPGGYGVSWTDEIDISAEELWAHGTACVSPFAGLLSFAEATGLWGLSESALRKAVEYRKLAVGVDVQKFGKQWVVTRSAMEREYGELPHSL